MIAGLLEGLELRDVGRLMIRVGVKRYRKVNDKSAKWREEANKEREGVEQAKVES
jgi:hypothetical protein